MAFPTFEDATSGFNSTNSATHTITYPATVNADDLLVHWFTSDDNTYTTSGWAAEGWTVIVDDFASTGSQVLGNCAYLYADGTETGTFDITTSGDIEKSAWVILRFSGAEDPATQAPEVQTNSAVDSLTVDPPSITPTGGAKDYIFIAFSGADQDAVTPAYPANYINTGTVASSGAGFVTAAWGTRALNATSEDPAAFVYTGTADAWVAATVAIHPAAAGGGSNIPVIKHHLDQMAA